MTASNKGLRVAVVGATGLVGHELLGLLESRRFPVGELLPFSSGRSKRSVRFRGRNWPAPAVSKSRLEQADLIFLVSSDAVALKYGRALARAGKWVIDDSSAFRLDSRVPLVIPEVNAAALSKSRRLIAGPNCTLTGAAVAGYPLIKAAGASGIHISSYQAVSGAGKAALEEFLGQIRKLAGSAKDTTTLAAQFRSLRASALPRAIAFNVIPQVGPIDERGHSSEEIKVAAELRKILGLQKLPISVSAVRVPVLRGHSLSFWLRTSRRLSPSRVRALLRRAPSVKLYADHAYPTPHHAHGTAPVHVGRIREGGGKNEISMWVVSDNLLKGAALNSVQIAEELLKRGWLRR